MTPLELAKERLPLPELMERLGLGDCAKKSARCPFHEDRSNSFSVFQSADGQWRWNCFAGCSPNGKPGDGPDLIAKLENIGSADACRRYIDLAGGSTNAAYSQPRALASQRTKTAVAERQPEHIPPMPADYVALWHEGLEHLQGRPVIATRLASLRGWPVEFAQYLIGCGGVAMVQEKGKRGFAFQVVVPEGERGAMRTRPIGYHVRVENSPADYSWRYRPPEGIPCLPYIVGDFETAKLLVITEGQWDALSFGFAAGWIGDDCLWPKGVGLIGIRGWGGWNTFLTYYRRYWPEAADCLLLADNDPNGKKWHTGNDCFAVQLSKLCRKVAVVDCEPFKDFNDLYRSEKAGPDDVREILAAHGMSAESEVIA